MNRNTLLAAAMVVTIMGGISACFCTDIIERMRRPSAPNALTLPLRPTSPVAPPGAPAVTEVDYKPLAPQTAQEINSAVPIENVGPPAQPFHIAADAPTWDRASQCLAQAIYYEAGAENTEGQRAVAQVVLNRVRSPAFPNSVCGVVYQGAERSTGCQFTFTCDGSLGREPSSAGWRRALSVASSALRGKVFAPVGNATHYHADYVVPYWAASMAKIRTIGAHNFYRWPGSWRAGVYFSQRYANIEPLPGYGLADTSKVPGSLNLASATLAAPSQAVVDTAAGAHRPPAIIPAIDRIPHTLLVTDKAPALKPGLDRINVLSADLQGGRLDPAPAMRVRP